MRIFPPPPKLNHPPAVYEAICREHEQSTWKMGRTLLQVGWSADDVADAELNWPWTWLAAAVANERQSRGQPVVVGSGTL